MSDTHQGGEQQGHNVCKGCAEEKGNQRQNKKYSEGNYTRKQFSQVKDVEI